MCTCAHLFDSSQETLVAADQEAALPGFGVLQQGQHETVGAFLGSPFLQGFERGVRLGTAEDGQRGKAGQDENDQGAENLQAGVESRKHAARK